jgi:hypothetical protein
MIKILISISRLTLDNHLIVEFHKTDCVIKDEKTWQVLLEGGLSNGLYYIPFHVDISQ